MVAPDSIDSSDSADESFHSFYSFDNDFDERYESTQEDNNNMKANKIRKIRELELSPNLINQWEHKTSIEFSLPFMKQFIDRIIDEGAGGPDSGWIIKKECPLNKVSMQFGSDMDHDHTVIRGDYFFPYIDDP